jgi:anthranilate synthase/aminodeoxychorismate synthase-like glutamine amidotransferase
MVLLIDNYDSFTYNLVQRLGELDAALDIRVHRNDQITLDEIEAARPDHIIISPGPCTPREGGISNDVIRRFGGRVPLLGVCLGHQCLGYVHGANVIRAPRLMHGKTSMIQHDGAALFDGLSNPFQATRYHSLIIQDGTLPSDFVVCATSADDPTEIMAIRHRQQPMFGVQFHPESFLTLEGHKLLANFLRIR